MSRKIMLIPVGSSVGLTTISLGLVRAVERTGVKVQFFKPIAQQHNNDSGPERSTTILSRSPTITPLQPFTMDYAEELIGSKQLDILLEDIVARAATIDRDTGVTILEGLVPTPQHGFADEMNKAISNALDADIVFVAIPGEDSPAEIKNRLEIMYHSWGGASNKRILGCIINKIGAPIEGSTEGKDTLALFDDSIDYNAVAAQSFQLPGKSPLKVLGAIPYQLGMVSPRASDLAKHLRARILNGGELDTRRLTKVTFCTRSIPNMIEHITPGSLLVTSGDRADVLVAACLAAMNGVKIGAVLLTGGYEPEGPVIKLCEQAFETGLPIFLVESNTWNTAIAIQRYNDEVPVDDTARIEIVQDSVARHISSDWISSITDGTVRERRLSPAAFRFQLTELARQAKKTVVLPEGDEPRTVQAAAIAAERGIAKCVLIGNPEEIHRVAEQQGVTLGEGIEIIDPELTRHKYVAPMVELRKHKGLEEVMAATQLEDTVVLGTMMLALDEVDGLVSGAVHTTANTIRPPLQLVKTAPGASLVSSVFFMLLPDQVLIYGDCAINPDPTAEQLADIAIQSAESAEAFGIEPRVAMISYSTGSSGTGSDVEKVREATKLAQAKRPDLMIDGPLQYDAAVMPNVAKSKAPNSPVAGKANVFVFPDLNTGNTTYKAVQRSADLISIGPMLQGMRKPVNDLSRGALVDDIVYTIALTAIQAAHND
ncbi:phosphate acetyltransferase [Paraferrimonas sp. SM1919]|uniref:phosphate acetyltransferase n=1 Tax=Paraferrimonas sp. SM1919 TaxID=2662263 RepID=UPI0013CF86D7|nr:phosphate acetyltransferase [Paraferrimonas sp. SM1919]